MIIGLANFKGGVGKTVLALNVATELDRLGYRVALLDAEEGAPAKTALARIAPQIPAENSISLEAIDDAIGRLRASAEVIVFDTPGKSGDEFLALCMLADLILIPLGPSKKDLRGTKPLLTLLRGFQAKANGSPPSYLVLNFTRVGDVAARRLREQLEPLGIPIAKTQLRRLDDYRDHDTVMLDPVLNERKAAADIRQLMHELFLDKLPTPKTRANE